MQNRAASRMPSQAHPGAVGQPPRLLASPMSPPRGGFAPGFAIRALAANGAPDAIGEIAYLLGYSEPAAFHRAFKRWYAVTPERFRASHQS